MKVILTPNLNPPFNLRRVHYSGSLRARYDTEDQAIAACVLRNKEVGVVPCASEVERDQYLAAYAQKFPDLPIIDLPPVGPHWIVDEVDLPGGGISDDNKYFFNAWVWTSAGRVDVDIPKARDEHRRRLVMAKRDELRRLEEAMDIADGPEHARLAALESNLRAFRPGSFNLAAYDTPDALKAAWPSELPPREA